MQNKMSYEYSSEIRAKMEERYREMGAKEENVSELVDDFNHRLEDTTYYLLEKAVRNEQQAHFIGNMIIPRLEAVASQRWLENGFGAVLSDTQIANLIGNVLADILKAATASVNETVTVETEFRTSYYNKLTQEYEPLFVTRMSQLLCENRAKEKALEYNKFAPDRYCYDVNDSGKKTETRKITTKEQFGVWETVEGGATV